MKKAVAVTFFIALLLSCTKKETDNLIWEKSYGKGEAYFIKASPDSGIYACGQVTGKPYFVRLDKKRSLVIELKPDIQGVFSSAWSDTSGYITGGIKSGKILLMRHSIKGNLLWEISTDPGFKIDLTRLFYTGEGKLMALGTSCPDSIISSASGLYFLRFDTTGHVLSERKISETSSISSVKAEVDEMGNIFLALTRSAAGLKSRACVAKYDTQLHKLWETQIFTNSDFSSASFAILPDGSGRIFVAGRTELLKEGSKVSNSFLVLISSSGSLSDEWKEKRYLENHNEGTAVILDNKNNLLMLNRNCFIVNIVNPADGTDAGIIRPFSVCVSKETDAFGSDMDICSDDNILMAGSKGGNFYLAVKSSL